MVIDYSYMIKLAQTSGLFSKLIYISDCKRFQKTYESLFKLL